MPISTLVDSVITVAPLVINHQSQFPSVTLSFNLAPGASLGAAVAAIQQVQKDLKPPLSLQTSFQEVLGISPLAYLRTLRLNGARRMLLRGEPTMMVRDAVETWGFWHFSRFSEEYRQLFGELPSWTLHRAKTASQPG